MEGLNTDFLKELVCNKASSRIKLLRKAEKAELESIGSCIINIRIDKKLKKFSSKIKKFLRLKFTINKLRQYCIKNIKFVIAIVATVLADIIQDGVQTVCSNG